MTASSPSWKLAGFLLFVGIYFIVVRAFYAWPPETVATVVLKLLPIFLLWIMVAESKSSDSHHPYRRSILLGLTFSAVGDGLLVMRNSWFLYGAAAFATAQAMYIRAFGLQPFGGAVLSAFYAALGAVCYAVVFGWLSARMTTAIRNIIVVYIALITTMAWRSAVRCMEAPGGKTVAAAVGALVFVASDFMIVIDKFGPSFHLAPFWIILTYYMAQCLIALSAVN